MKHGTLAHKANIMMSVTNAFSTSGLVYIGCWLPKRGRAMFYYPLKMQFLFDMANPDHKYVFKPNLCFGL